MFWNKDRTALNDLAHKAETALEESIGLARELTDAYRDANRAREEALAAKEQAYKFGTELVRVRKGVVDACEKAVEGLKNSHAGELSAEELRSRVVSYLQDILRAAGDEEPNNE